MLINPKMKKKKSERRKRIEDDRAPGIEKIENDHASDAGLDHAIEKVSSIET